MDQLYVHSCMVIEERNLAMAIHFLWEFRCFNAMVGWAQFDAQSVSSASPA
jgi:hypothetical protein